MGAFHATKVAYPFSPPHYRSGPSTSRVILNICQGIFAITDTLPVRVVLVYGQALRYRTR